MNIDQNNLLQKASAEDEQPLEIDETSSAFSAGQIVSLKSNPSVKGAVIEVLPGRPENRVKVFVDSNIQTYYAS